MAWTNEKRDLITGGYGYGFAVIETADVWSRRAREFGRRCVLDLSIPESQYDEITAFQKAVLLPILKRNVHFKPHVIVDYGCGCGRFTNAIRRITSGSASVGYDPCQELVSMAIEANTDPHTRFASGPLDDYLATIETGFDLLWISLVLGGIAQDDLTPLIIRLTSSLAVGGGVFVAEHTDEIYSGNAFWRFRPKDFYIELLASANITADVVGSYMTLGNKVSVFYGVKNSFSKP